MSSVDVQPAFVLHHRAYRDTSLLLELFTPMHGRVGLVARGARGAKSRYKGILQPFQPLLCSWGGRGELGTLRAAELAGRMPVLRGQALYAAYYLNELVMRLTQRQDPHPEVFHAYSLALQELARERVEPALRRFEKRSLEGLGYGLILDRDIAGRALDPGARYRYIPEQGPESLGEAAGGRAGISGRALLALHEEAELDEAALRELKELMRAVLPAYIGERPLKTRQFILTMARHEQGREPGAAE